MLPAVETKEAPPTLQSALEDGLLVILEVGHLQDKLPKRPGALNVVAPVGEEELVLFSLVAEPAGERIRVAPPPTPITRTPTSW